MKWSVTLDAFSRRLLAGRDQLPLGSEAPAIGHDGIPAGNLHFVRKRPDKHPVCERLGVTYFMDDRLDLLAHLTTVEHRYLFTGARRHREPPDVGAAVVDRRRLVDPVALADRA